MRRATTAAGLFLLMAASAGAAPELRGRREAIAAAARAPGLPEAWAEADALVVAAGSHDRGVAGAAARALVGIARRYASDGGAEDALVAGWSADARAKLGAALAAIAARPEVFVEVRVHAMEAAVLLGDAAIAGRLAGDGDAELRRAAVAWLDPARAEDAAKLAEIVAGDADDVAATAAAVLCRAGAKDAAKAAVGRRTGKLADGAADPGDAPLLASCLR